LSTGKTDPRGTEGQEWINAEVLRASGVWQREGSVPNLIATWLVDLTHLLGRLLWSARRKERQKIGHQRRSNRKWRCSKQVDIIEVMI
jgi:hypothetical protein